MNSKNIMRSLSIAAATLATTAVFADPFSGLIVEGGLGAAQMKSDGRVMHTVNGRSDPAAIQPDAVGDITLNSQSKTLFAGRLGIGYAYTFPTLNFNLAGLLTYNFGSYEIKENGILSGRGFAGAAGDNNLGTWVTKLKDVGELRIQPGYYFSQLRTLVYGTVGYASAKFDTSGSGQNLTVWTADAGSGRASGYGKSSANLDGLVLGFGAKFSPIAKAYVGFDYSHVSYNKKSLHVETIVSSGPAAPFPSSWQGDTGKIKSDTYLLTVGYYFF